MRTSPFVDPLDYDSWVLRWEDNATSTLHSALLFCRLTTGAEVKLVVLLVLLLCNAPVNLLATALAIAGVGRGFVIVLLRLSLLRLFPLVTDVTERDEDTVVVVKAAAVSTVVVVRVVVWTKLPRLLCSKLLTAVVAIHLSLRNRWRGRLHTVYRVIGLKK